MTTQISVSVDPKTLADALDAQIRAQIVDSLKSKSPDALVNAVVAAALGDGSNSWDRQSAFRKALDTAIRNEADQAIKDLIAEERPRIREMLRTKITADRLVDHIFDSVLESQFYLSVSLKDGDQA